MRDYETLLRHGEEVLAQSRQDGSGSGDVAVLPRPGGVSAVGSIGRVLQANATDPEHGPHLVARLQTFEGSPPVPQDVPDADVVCYPSPNRSVGDFVLGEFVQLVVAQGAVLGMKLG